MTLIGIGGSNADLAPLSYLLEVIEAQEKVIAALKKEEAMWLLCRRDMPYESRLTGKEAMARIEAVEAAEANLAKIKGRAE